MAECHFPMCLPTTSAQAEVPPFVHQQRVRAQDCAESGHLGHPRLFEYLEAAMSEAWRDRVEPLPEFFASGLHLTVAEAGLRFFAPASFDDLLTVEVGSSDVSESSFELEYHVRREETPLAYGRCRYVCVHDAGKPAPLPDVVRGRLRELGADEADCDPVLALARFYAEQDSFYRGGPSELVADCLTQDVTWTVPGDNAIAGTYRGKTAVLRYFTRRRSLAKSGLRIVTGKVLRSGDLLIQFARGEAEIEGKTLSWETFGAFRIRAGKIAECWLVPLDQDRFDEVWSITSPADQEQP